MSNDRKVSTNGMFFLTHIGQTQNKNGNSDEQEGQTPWENKISDDVEYEDNKKRLPKNTAHLWSLIVRERNSPDLNRRALN